MTFEDRMERLESIAVAHNDIGIYRCSSAANKRQ